MATPAPPAQIIVFICNGVHTNPADTTKHVAQTTDEIRDQTAQHGCQFWQVLVPPK
jgi:hypothetical protein